MREMRFTPLWLGIGWLLIATVIWLSLTPAPPRLPGDFDGADKVGHWLAYFVLAGWFVQLYCTWGPRLRYGLFFVIMGIGLEFLQEWGGVRSFEVIDMVAGVLGVAAGLTLGLTPAAGALQAMDRRLG